MTVVTTSPAKRDKKNSGAKQILRQVYIKMKFKNKLEDHWPSTYIVVRITQVIQNGNVVASNLGTLL